ncbi:hypothetical protein HCN44_002845 [Aphidius gifuensis]|uniref:DNA mismatch repair protein n=1 Tax=Aphidius gifuensis TaxID=684658 RepID=A0A834XRM2_APHGI|nr:hypothetical protein HCN44_002845 [Aphidius gifuensis]
MSKRTPTQKNTLFNYFKSPKSVDPKKDDKPTSTAKDKTPTTPKRAPTTSRLRDDNDQKKSKEKKRVTRKRPLKSKSNEDDDDNKNNKMDESDDEEEEIEVSKPKRRRIIIPDEDSEGYDATESEFSENVTESDAFTEETEEEETPKKKSRLSQPKSKSSTATATKTTTDDNFQLQKAPAKTGPASGGDTWPHLNYDFLQPDKIRDKERRLKTNPDYDYRTVYVPDKFLDNQTPAMRQWWILKSQYYDCVLFFKVGKFYELYHMDAVIGAKELGISYMRGEWAHSGFPEIAYGRFSCMLIEKGYKVARIEQTENPEMMAERCKTSKKVTKFDKVVRREICQVSTCGTRIATVQDPEIITPYSNYLLSIIEKIDTNTKLSTYGVCFIDTTIGEFHLGQFNDDRCNSRLLTLLSHYTPVHVVYERGNLSQDTMKILNTLLSTAIKEPLQKDVQFWSSTKTLKALNEGDYFKDDNTNEITWPNELKLYLSDDDSLNLTPANNKELAVKALGGCIYLLKSFVLDQQLLSQKHFQTYTPPDTSFIDENKSSVGIPPVSSMVLDAITIHNLRIFGNDASLLKTLDHCCTAFGKRLLKEWMCRPSCRKNIIMLRQEAVTELTYQPDIVQEVRKLLNNLPDLERLLSKIHTHGNASRMKNHPDGRAIMFEGQIYSKRKIVDFITALNGFEIVTKIIKKFHICESELLKKTTMIVPDGEFPDIQETLEHFKTAFDHEAAKKIGSIVPQKGVDAEFDKSIREFDIIKQESEDYLKKQMKHFDGKVTFVGSDKKRYQLEVPESKCHKATSKHELQGQRKGFKRYYTDETKEFLSRQIKAEEYRNNILKDLNRRVFSKFSENYDLWSIAVYKIAILDVLLSFCEYAKSVDTCIPEIIDNDTEICTIIKDGKHPCIQKDNFVSNDTSLAGDDTASLVILTGPNMGGKSTLMRQVGLLTVMAQMGCHIPASSCKLSITDRIFTRLGASDDLLTGRSTFLIELSETATILQHASKKSLVLLDELGRGTSTYDGTAIAAAVVNSLTKLKCRTLFSTHYHSLVEDYKKSHDVSLAYMACQVEADEDDEITEETVTFLYKFVPGACPKSYGFNAARLGGVPSVIIKRATEIAKKLEKEANQRNMFSALCRANSDVKSIISKLKNTVLV